MHRFLTPILTYGFLFLPLLLPDSPLVLLLLLHLCLPFPIQPHRQLVFPPLSTGPFYTESATQTPTSHPEEVQPETGPATCVTALYQLHDGTYIQAPFPGRPQQAEQALRHLLSGARPQVIQRNVDKFLAGQLPFCHDCRRFRSLDHKDCLSQRHKSNYDALIGDVLFKIDLHLLQPGMDGATYSALSSNSAMATYLRANCPELVPAGASDHTAGTIFEALYLLRPSFRVAYLRGLPFTPAPVARPLPWTSDWSDEDLRSVCRV